MATAVADSVDQRVLQPPQPSVVDNEPEFIVSRVYARVGLLGNPSDGYNGCTVSLSLMNFFAEVRSFPVL